MKNTLAELRAMAENMGIEVPKNARKAELIEMIEKVTSEAQVSLLGEEDSVVDADTLEFGEVTEAETVEPSIEELMAQAEEVEEVAVEAVEDAVEEPVTPVEAVVEYEEYVSDFDMSDVKTTMIHVDDLISSDMNFFKPLNAKKFNELKESIKANGLLVPLIARAVENGYEILAGHNRHKASVELGIEELPVRVVDVDDDKAREIMIDTNVTQRLEMSPMEIARAYAEKWAIIGNRQGKRTDLNTDSQTGATRDIIAQQYGKSGMTIERYMRLNRLTPELQYLIDEGDLSLRVGTEIGLMNTDTQENLFKAIQGVQDAPKLLSSSNIGKVKKHLKAQAKAQGETPETATLKVRELKTILMDDSKAVTAPIKLKFELPHDTDRELLAYLQDTVLANPDILLTLIGELKLAGK